MITIIKLEDYFFNIAKKEGKPSVIICDRGVMDTKAYINEATWQMVLDETGWNEMTLRERRYDGVIHLVTAAEGAEGYYTTANNEARSEDKEIALWIDHNLRRAWNGHPNLRIIGNEYSSFDSKIKAVWSHVSTMIGEPAESGYYKKFLIDSDFQIPSEIPHMTFFVEETILACPHENMETRATKSVNPNLGKQNMGPQWSWLLQREDRIFSAFLEVPIGEMTPCWVEMDIFIHFEFGVVWIN